MTILTKEAERLDIPFRFSQLVTHLNYLIDGMLVVKTRYSIIIIIFLQFHALLVEDQDFDHNFGVGGNGGEELESIGNGPDKVSLLSVTRQISCLKNHLSCRRVAWTFMAKN